MRESDWVQAAVALIGFGNTAYAMGDLAAAEIVLRQATLAHPRSADAWNNLAHVLSDMNRHGEALAAARRAHALGGERREAYGQTLSEVRR